MRICMVSIGTEGDVRPFVALGQRLAAAGHQTSILTDISHAAFIANAGLQLVAVQADSGLILRRNRRHLDGRNTLSFWKRVRRAYRSASAAWMGTAVAGCSSADLIISSWINAPFAQAVAELHGLPFVAVSFMPLTPSRWIPALWPSPVRLLPRRMNLAAHRLTRFLLKSIHSPRARATRRALGLPARSSAHRLIYAFSPRVLPPPPDWPPASNPVVGFWDMANGEAGWTPPPGLVDFFAAGPVPIYVGFGSMVGKDRRAFTQTVVDAVRMAGRRAILSIGWGALSKKDIVPSDDIFVIDRAPHDWLFRHVDVAVHHGGAGTLASAARAGVPQVIVPFLLDQPFWAWQAHAVGVSPAVLDQRTVTTAALADAIREAGTESIRTAARRVAELLREEDGIENTMTILRDWGLIPTTQPLSDAPLEKGSA